VLDNKDHIHPEMNIAEATSNMMTMTTMEEDNPSMKVVSQVIMRPTMKAETMV